MPKRKIILTTRAEEVFRMIVAYKLQNDGNSPSMREIGASIRVNSSSLISYYLDELEQAGRIIRSKNDARGICIVGGRYTYQPESVEARE